MRLNCITGQHDAAPGEVRNQGFAFSHCRCCGCDMVRSDREWRRVPRGFRVVWRRRPPRHFAISTSQLRFDLLPPTGRSLIVAPRRGRLSAMFIRIVAGLRSLSGAAGGRLRAFYMFQSSPAGSSPARTAPYGPARPEALLRTGGATP